MTLIGKQPFSIGSTDWHKNLVAFLVFTIVTRSFGWRYSRVGTNGLAQVGIRDIIGTKRQVEISP